MPLSFDNPSMQSQQERLLQLLTKHSFQEREVVLSSGKKSNFYIDCKQTSLLAEGHFLIGQLFCALIRKHAPQAVAVGGLTLGADPMASAISLSSFIGGHPLQAFLIRKESKGHGTDKYLEGIKTLSKRNSPVVILEDVVTTGASTIKAIERTQAAGLDVVLSIALVDRDEGGKEAIEKHSPLISLFTRHDFLS